MQCATDADDTRDSSAEPLRVLYSFPHPLGSPGIGTTAINQVRGLANAGHRVTVYTTSVAQPLPPAVTVVTTMTIGGRRVPHRAIGLDRAYRHHDLTVSRVIRRRAADFDVLHAWPRGCLASFAAARRLGVVSFRESPNPHTAAAFADANRAAKTIGVDIPKRDPHHPDPRRLAIEEAEYDAADLILCPSEYVVQSYLERHLSPERLVRHRYGFDPLTFPPRDTRDPARPFTAVFLGRAEPRKGLHLALRAWIDARLPPDSTLLIAGVIDPTSREVLAPLIAEAKAIELGFQGDPGAVLRRSDVLLLPSFSEGSALVVYEALASGVVPLVSDAAGAPIIDGVDGFVHAVGDVAALTAHLSKLASQPETLDAFRQAALRRREDLTWQLAGEALAGAYRTGVERCRQDPVTGNWLGGTSAT